MLSSAARCVSSLFSHICKRPIDKIYRKAWRPDWNCLWFQPNALNDDEKIVLFKHLRNNKVIHMLRFEGSQITKTADEVAIEIGMCLESGSWLGNLNLFGNGISEEGLLTIIDSLRNNDSIYELSLGMNQLTNKVLEALIELTDINKNLRRLNVMAPPSANLRSDLLQQLNNRLDLTSGFDPFWDINFVVPMPKNNSLSQP